MQFCIRVRQRVNDFSLESLRYSVGLLSYRLGVRQGYGMFSQHSPSRLVVEDATELVQQVMKLGSL